MHMKTRLRMLPMAALFITLVFTSFAAPVFAADEKTLTYDYYFEADSADDLSYSADEEELVIDGKHYRLTDVKCELYSEPITEKKSLKSKNKEAEPYITKMVEGTEIKLYAPSNIEWTDNSVEYKQEYKTEAEVPETAVVEDKELALKSIEPGSRTENVSTTAKFYSDDPNTREYIFNGKTVILRGSDPEWDGYINDYAEYLGIKNDNDYAINGSYWNGAAVKTDGGYVRTATIYGTKTVNYVIATYGLKDDDEKYTAEITYTSKYIGHAVATYDRYMTTKQKLIYAGVGLALLALLATSILFILKRKREEDTEETEA